MLTSAACVATILTGPAAAPAAARESGVHFDPQSPAGKEYALPLSQARSEAAGGDAGGPPGSPAPLFGVGVSGRGATDATAPRRAAPAATALAGGTGGPGRAARNSPARSGERRPPRSGPAPGPRLSGGERYPLASGIGLTAALVLAGIVLALALRGFAARRGNLGSS